MTPLLVLLPGLDGTPILFEPILDKLGIEALPVSYPQTVPSDYDTLLPVVLAGLPKDRDFVLLGWSFSGPLALMAAATRPPGLRGVVLCASFVQKPLGWVPKFARHLAWPVMFRISGSMAVAKTVLAGFGNPVVNRLIKKAHDAVPPKAMAARVKQVLTVDVRDELKACPVPILYLEAASDRIVPKRNVRSILRVRPDVVVRTIPGPHLALALSPDAAATELRAFVVDCAKAAAAQAQTPANRDG